MSSHRVRELRRQLAEEEQKQQANDDFDRRWNEVQGDQQPRERRARSRSRARSVARGSRSASRPRSSGIAQQIRQLRNAQHEENGRGGIRIHGVQETDERQQRNVRLTIRGRVDVYEGGRVLESNVIEEVEYCTVNFNTREGLVDGIQNQLSALEQKMLALEADSPKKVFYKTWVGAQDGYSEEHMREVAQRPDVAEMYRAEPIDYRHFKGIDVNRLDINDPNQFNCVVEYLFKTYSAKIPTLIRNKIVEFLSEGSIIHSSDAKKQGWTITDVQRFCDHYKISHYVLDGFNRLVHKKVESGRNYPALMYYCEDGHMYPIVDKQERNHLVKVLAEKNDRQSGVLAQDNEKKHMKAEKAQVKRFKQLEKRENVPLDKLSKLSNCIVYYHKLHLKDMLLQLYRKTGVMYEFKHIGKLVTYIEYDNNVHLYANCNHRAGCDWNTSIEIAEKLGLPYTNQSLASLSQQYFVKNYHPKGKKQARMNIAKELKATILREQRNCCNHCKMGLVERKWECDHVIPISCGGNALARSNLQILCVACHAAKSAKEAAEMLCNIDNSASYYNESTLKVFGEKPLNAIVHNFVPWQSYIKDVKSGHKILAGLDINKCRTYILRYGNKTEWNSFSVLNDPVKFNEELHGTFPRGFYYVESDNLLPLKGNNWICVAALKHCLKYNVIQRSQIKYVVLSSLGLAPGYFRKYVTDITDAAEDPKIWKLMVNSLIGIMGVRKSVNRHFKILSKKKYAAAYIYEKQVEGQSITVSPRVFDEEDDNNYDKHGVMIKPDFYEVMFNKERLKEESHFPIFAQILQQEACELHLIQMLLEKHGGKLVYCNTDNAIALFDSQKQVDAMYAEADTIFWDEEKKVKKYKPANSINDYERTDRINEQKYVHTKLHHHIEKDPGHNDFTKLAKRLLKANESFEIDAMAGCGKTTLLREIMSELDKRNETWLACTPTHKSAKVLYQDKKDPKRNAKTIHRALGALKFGGWSSFAKYAKYNWIIVDEKSMVKENFFMLLYKIKKACPTTKFIICGDWGQLPPVMDRSATFNYAESYCIWDLCDGNMMKLSQCRRSDRELFELYANIAAVNRKSFPSELCQKNICYLNSTRKDINYYWMMKRAPKHKHRLILKAHPKVDQSQDTIVYKGLPLVAMSTRMGLGFCNADQFTVASFDKKEIVLRYEDEDEDDAEEKLITIPASELTHLFAPSYAISCHRAQGSSISEPFGIFDWDKMDDKLKYVALSRSRKLKYINMGSTIDIQPERDL